MSSIKLFRRTNGQTSELLGSASDLDTPLQTLNEQSQGRSPRSRKRKEKSHA